MFESERRDLAWVPRWSIVRVNRRQSVAEHSYFVCCYGLEIARRIGWPGHGSLSADCTDLYDLTLYLLRHDEAEAYEGDIPGPAKRLGLYDPLALAAALTSKFGPPPDVTNDMRAIKDVADLVDECLYLAGEMAGGNGTVHSVLQFVQQRLHGTLQRLPCAAGAREQLAVDLRGVIERESRHTKDMTPFMTPTAGD